MLVNVTVKSGFKASGKPLGQEAFFDPQLGSFTDVYPSAVFAFFCWPSTFDYYSFKFVILVKDEKTKGVVETKPLGIFLRGAPST